ncbi:hypothetical protein O0I10_000458 [Lichtheimia ornata]|uniref:Cytochrome c oxidase subunit IV n=1 Tax=Lichtheimia ornata TaxID=688661 RepID=A0AAD7Y5C8_9FUNG|nr:uncharacterized protein O0I10_000458 [Lichtheimia ornata]KAJ8664179.1 hypothetical protein O0I10_000458 [Lichtheimia ornata]
MIARRVWMAASTAVRGRRNASTVALQDLKTRWPAMSTTEQNTIAKELEEVQKQDWNVMSTEDKKAAYYIAFGEHGPRTPVVQPGDHTKVAGGVVAVLTTAATLFYILDANGQEKPMTTTREWEEATNELFKRDKINPITGIASEGYKGKGYVTHK